MFEENEISKNANGGTEIAKRKLASIIDPSLLEHFQIISSRVRELDETKIRILWQHDLPQDPESLKLKEKSFVDKFHKLVYISNWQMQQYQLFHNLPYNSKSIVLESGIEPVDPMSRWTHGDGKIRLVYTSTPQRGLDILVPVVERLSEKHPNIHLDVFSSFKIYGWDEADKQFEPLYDKIRSHPNMTYHGFTPNEQLKHHLNSCDIFAYPCTWVETSCRAMLEAMSAGLVCVHPNYGALPETSGSLNIMYQGSTDKAEHANIFMAHLDSAINFVHDKHHEPMIHFNKIFVDSRYNIKNIKTKWEFMLKELLDKYPTVESRHFPKPQFVYRTS
jgi:UDP-glucose:(glucosyl)LPS alpha-1,2-glucosyltransferase